ncbi:hypothetical protein GUITHDRAFT_91415 [Guillardia theta CCMP2712]|uniref:Ribosome biogenesis protein BMS1/TSR1 C-terminal domain-containing protein n=2 Tax=Guillardia theta TaxID=55529 RepID=L1K2X4_GUITC|nr:hypothetical protein GUITHDRAFT_91415 [Guillardia theta CCMP2712]EKX54723.1 hypothetical protein GUITHDRAFT_91415 [Guillardia theta CCMP2712]|eukprot:XP_005841703.1 hypothetical protein GUITHDRAFT_91415 [Guillardia theta CCMP2712]
MTLMNCSVDRFKEDGDVIKGKDQLILVCGMRRIEVRPIYSEQKNNSDKFKLLRYLPARGTCIASMYAPAIWPPAPVLLLKRQKSGALTIVATGKSLGPNANRIVLKRIVLTGLPYKIHKRKATCRFMFHNPEDVRWFKPVELWTKEGRRGQIREPLGTHGYMKCLFDAPILHSDTVCMSLYKRVYPPYPENAAKQLKTNATPQ